MKNLRVYICGPVESAGGNWNAALFDHVAAKLRDAGCEVFNPIDHIRRAFGSLERAMALGKIAGRRARTAALRDELLWIFDHANAMTVLPGWEQCGGARVARLLAEELGLEIRETGTIVLPAS